MKKLLKCMVMAVASFGLAFTGCKVDDGGSTPIFLPIGGSGGSSSAVVAPEIDYEKSTLPSAVTYAQDARSPKLMVKLANEDKGEWVYKWYKDGFVITGAESFVYLPDTSAACVGEESYYEVEVANKQNEKVSVKSDPIKVNVVKAVNPAEINAAHVAIKGISNESKEYTAGDTALPFTVTYEINKDATNLEGTVKVEWFDENGNLLGTDDSYTPDIPTSLEGVKTLKYKVVVTNDCTGTATGNKISSANSELSITVKSASISDDSVYAAPITINAISGTMEYVAGQPATELTVTSSVTESTTGKKGTVTYKWYTSENGSAVADGVKYTPDISKYSSVSAETAVSIWVEAINDCSATATTEPKIQSSGKKEVKITVKPAATTPDIDEGQPKDGNYSKNDTAEALKVVANANGVLSYQWYKNSSKSTVGATAISGATSNTYVPSTTTVGVTYYYCVVTNTLNGTTKTNNSGIATVTVAEVAATPTSVVISNKTENSITVGNTKTYSVTVTLSDGTKVYNANWVSNNSSVVSVDNSGNVTAVKAGSAIIKATYTAGGVEKYDSVTITVTDAPAGTGNSGISIDFN